MARLIPDMPLSEIEIPGERAMAEALVSQLPKRVEIVHSFNWIGQDRKERLVEGECDFVMIDPDNGIIFFEVKSGGVAFDPSANKWRRTLPDGRVRTLGKNPFDQVRSSMHEIVKRISRSIGASTSDFPFTYGYAVAFPDSRCVGELPANVTPDLVLDAAKCRELDPCVEAIFSKFRRPAHRAMTPQEAEGVQRALFPEYSIMPVLWRQVQHQEEGLKRLTEEQARILGILASHPLAAIQGVAGSGKTLLAVAKAQDAASKGMRTLLLCYNKPLKEWLAKAMPEELDGNLTVENYHSLAYAMCKHARVEFKIPADDTEYSFWQEKAPDLLVEACEKLGPEHKFDAVVADEGQDFLELWWESLEYAFRDPDKKACFYVFSDPAQKIYLEKAALPDCLGQPYLLSVNCRNTESIAKHCAELLGQAPEVRPGAPVGSAPEFQTAPDLPAAFRLAGKAVRDWVMPNAGGLKPSQVAVLAPSRSKDAWPKDFKTVPATTELAPWRDGEGVLLATWSRFKGLEADAVAIVDDLDGSDPKATANRYVARSRAKHLLKVIEVKGETG